MKNSMVDTVVAAALGAAAMYYFDPEMGRRRRAMLRDRLSSECRHAERFLRSRVQWASDRMHGLAAQARSGLASEEEPASDRRITERVRAAIGRVVSTPGAVDVSVAVGSVLLTGHILAAERPKLLAAVSAVPGVEHVSDQLTEHDEPGNVPELQGAAKV
jgi:osmotically-inducible protein OsmY